MKDIKFDLYIHMGYKQGKVTRALRLKISKLTNKKQQERELKH